MHSPHEFLKALAVVLGVAAVTTVVFQRLRQPVVLGYLLAGLIVGPHIPIPLVADREIIQTLSELGVIFLMFSLGLEFSLRKLIRVGPTAGLTALFQSSLMVWLGYLAGRGLGWSQRESVFAGAVIAISSTTIIAKAFDEQGIKGRVREFVVGILITEDLIGILLMAVLTAVASGGMSAGTVLRSGGKLVAFLAGFLIVGVLVVPRSIRAINRLKRTETTLVASIGICFAGALLAQAFGYSVALGAFLAGSLIAESGEEAQIEHLVAPVRDMFGAIFFVSVGMMIDPAVIAHHWLPVLVFTLVVIGGKILGVTVGAFFTGSGVRTSVQAGMSLAQIGEFSFIIAGLGIALHATGESLYAIAVAVSTVTTLTTPWLIRAGEAAARVIDRKLPRRLQTFVSLYGSWLEGLRTRGPGGHAARIRRLIKLLLLDGALLVGVLIGVLATWAHARTLLTTRIGVSSAGAGALLTLCGALISAPFARGVLRTARALGIALAEHALPSMPQGTLDLAAAPRRALVVALQLTITLLVGLPLLALFQPFVSGWAAGAVLLVGLTLWGSVLWRTTRGLHGHVRAGAELVVEVLTSQARKGSPQPSHGAQELADVSSLLPGCGKPVALRLPDDSAAVGRSLAELNLRGATGASVLAIVRGETGVTVPTAEERLRAGDVLALIGTSEAVAAATGLLSAGCSSEPGDALPSTGTAPEG